MNKNILIVILGKKKLSFKKRAIYRRMQRTDSRSTVAVGTRRREDSRNKRRRAYNSLYIDLRTCSSTGKLAGRKNMSCTGYTVEL